MRKNCTLLGLLFLASPLSVTAAQQLDASEDSIQTPPANAVNPCSQYSNNSSFINEYVQCLSKEVEKGSILASNILTSIYIGSGTLLPDYAKAAYYASISAEKDDPSGMQMLSLLNANGLGTEKNWDNALSLRRRQAQLYGALGPLWISGEFTGHGNYEAGVARVTVEVNPDGSKKSCSATGSTEKNHKFVCKVVMKVFGFLPAVSTEGREVIGRYSTNITLKPYVKPPKINTDIPARLVSGEITRQDLSSVNIESSTLVLNLELSPTGAIIACKSLSGNVGLTRAACQVAKRKLVFTPSKNVRGKGVASRFDLTVDLGSESSGGNAASLTANPEPVNKNSNSEAALDDKILETSIRRCELIGFEKGTSDYKTCVTDQIKILSGVR